MSELASLEHEPPTLDFLAKNRKAQIDVSHLAAPLVSAGIEQTNINHYRTKNTGHGYAAEDANALNDVLQGCKVELIGKTRELNGQTKNKIYVALSRMRGNLYLAPGKFFKIFKK